MRRTLIPMFAAAGITAGLILAPAAHAEPDVFGLITDDESQEIWANGQRNCVVLDQALDAGKPMADAVGALIDQYQADGWDLESSVDIVWESASGRCPEYLGVVKRAVRTYGDSS